MTTEDAISKRVFCIGMNKTGTSTMKHCFEVLKLTPIAGPGVYTPQERVQIRLFYAHKNYAPILDIAERFQSFEDRPWNMWTMYRMLHERFPDSRFILTERDPESWWRSTERWITVTKPEVLERYQLHLRVHETTQEAMTDSYLRYNQEVKDYFRGTGSLLVMNVEEGDGWDKLCGFLDMPIPEKAFPHANQQSYTAEDAAMRKVKRRMKHGLECQACQNLTIVKKPKKDKIPAALKKLVEGQSGQIPLHRKLSPTYISWRLKVLGPDRFKDSPSARKVFFKINELWRAIGGLKPARINGHKPVLCAPLPDRELAVVACFFNPGGSRKRVSNFMTFLEGIKRSGVHVQVVELAFGTHEFAITGHEDIIQLRTDNVLWHKERLLNIGIRRLLDEGYRKIAWLDGDITFANSNWPVEIANRLEQANLVQVFDTIAIQSHEQGAPMVAPCAIRYLNETGELYMQPARKGLSLLTGVLKGGQSGFGWAARAEVLEQVPLFESAVVGGGDKLMYAATLAEDFTDPRFLALTESKYACSECAHKNRSEAYRAFYLDWARRWSAAVDGKIDYARLHISDMYHGTRADRGYMTRHDILYRNSYNPETDLATDESGCLAWAGGKGKLKREVEAYFLSRREDV